MMDPQPAEIISHSTPRDQRQLTFLPVNQPRSPDSQRARRGYQSCDNCREKKKKCEPSAEGDSCWRCQLESRDCVTTHKRKRRKLRPPQAGNLTHGLEPTIETENAPLGSDGDMIHHSSQGIVNSPRRTGSACLRRTLNTKEQILSTNLLDARDALDLVAVAGSKDSAGEASLSLDDTHHSHRTGTSRSTHTRLVTAPVASYWDQFFLVKRGIIGAHEAMEYLDFYFSHLWDLFPVIPKSYSSPDRYGSLVVEEPVLTMSLITHASRYHPLTGFNGHVRSERIHWRAWPWVQRALQSSIWGSSGMRRVGSIAAMLLFIEWHPKAINSPEDLVSDYSEMELFDPPPHLPESSIDETNGRSESLSIPERLNIIAPAYRSNKMSWMLLSTAIALAQELGCFDEEQVLAHPRAKGTPPENNPVWLEWSHILRTYLCLIDEALALRLRLEPQLANTNWTEMVYRLPPTLTADGFLESTIDLATHMRKARELLLAWRKSEHGTGPAVSIAAWDSFKRGLDRWEAQRQFTRGVEQTDSSLRGVCLDIEYYYVRLCGLSPAAHMYEKSNTTDLHTTSLSQFAEAATKASFDMLELMTHYFSSSIIFKRAAVKYWLYIFCASLYLLKATLKTNEPLERTANCRIDLILRTVDAIRHNAPDDIHMSQRYAELLEILIQAALRPSSLPNSSAVSGTSRKEVRDCYASPSRREGGFVVESHLLNLGDEWIYDSNFWDTLPDMVGLNNIPDLVLPYFE